VTELHSHVTATHLINQYKRNLTNLTFYKAKSNQYLMYMAKCHYHYQVSKIIPQNAASLICHPLRLQLELFNLDHHLGQVRGFDSVLYKL